MAALIVAAYALSWSWVESVRDGASIAFWGLVCGFVATVAFSQRTSRGWSWLVGASLLGLVLASTVLWSVDPSHTFVEVVKFGAVLLVAACVGALMPASHKTPSRFVAAFAWLAPGAVACSLLAAVWAWTHDTVNTAGASGFFNGPNALGIFLALTLPFLLFHPFVRERLAVTLACVAVVAFISALAAGRTGLLALLVAIAVLELGARRWMRLVLGLAAVVAVTAVAHVWSPRVPTLGDPIAVSDCAGAPCVDAQGSPASPNQVDQLFGADRPGDQSRLSALVGARDEGWREAIYLLDERPIGGHGFGTGSMLFDQYNSDERFRYFVGAFAEGVNPHSSYLQMLLELGFVFGLIFFAPLLLAAVLAWKLVASGHADAPRLAFSSVLAASITAAAFESTLTQFGSLTLLSWVAAAGVLGLWLRNHRGAASPD